MKLLDSKSFSLVETLIAVGIIVMLVTIFFTSFITSFNYIRRIIELRTATLILQEEVSKVRNLKFTDIQSLGSSFSSSSMSSLNNAAGTIIKSPYNGQDKIIKITFGLDWTTFNGKAAHKTLVTLITDHGINKK